MPPAASRRESIKAAVVERLEAITVANGFNTDVGAKVYVDEFPALGPDDAREALALLTQVDELAWQGKGFLVRLPLTVMVFLDGDAAGNDSQRLEQAVADIKRAVELDDRLLGGLLHEYLTRGDTEVIPREPGSVVLGVAVTYVATFKEGWGAP